MDYEREADDPDGPKVHLALVLLPPASTESQAAPNHTIPDPPKKAPLVLNPGGPGGSGSLIAVLMGPSLQRALGADQPILGFDPRGVGFTTPAADCWAAPPPPGRCDGTYGNGTGPACEDDTVNGLLRRAEWEQVSAAYGFVGESEAAARYLEAGHRGVNALCRARDERHHGSSGLSWSGTTEVARDMARIVDKWDEWVDREEEKKAGTTETAASEREMRGKLVYWGFSYGSYLGATFARMFPDRVGRMLLDGVVDAELYEEPVWEESLVDADKVLDGFFRYCAAVGRKCALYRDGDRADDVRRRYEGVFEKLRTSPVTFTHPQFFYPVILRESLVKMLVFSTLYSPIQGFPGVAWILNCIYEGKYEQLSGMFGDAEPMCSLPGNTSLMELRMDAQRAVMCTDKRQPVSQY